VMMTYSAENVMLDPIAVDTISTWLDAQM
jgi:hypothetical protein